MNLVGWSRFDARVTVGVESGVGLSWVGGQGVSSVSSVHALHGVWFKSGLVSVVNGVLGRVSLTTMSK